jgi:hypothetical protein
MTTNKDIVKAALAGAFATKGVDYVVEHWDEIMARIQELLMVVA